MMTRAQQTSEPNSRLNKSKQPLFRRAEWTRGSIFWQLGRAGDGAVMEGLGAVMYKTK